VLSILQLFFSALFFQSNDTVVATLKQNLVKLDIPLPLAFRQLQRISNSLRGGNLRRLSVDVRWPLPRAVKMEDVYALFTKAEFPCLDYLQPNIPAPESDDEFGEHEYGQEEEDSEEREDEQEEEDSDSDTGSDF
jgi:hypothetical protein